MLPFSKGFFCESKNNTRGNKEHNTISFLAEICIYAEIDLFCVHTTFNNLHYVPWNNDIFLEKSYLVIYVLPSRFLLLTVSSIDGSLKEQSYFYSSLFGEKSKGESFSLHRSCSVSSLNG